MPENSKFNSMPAREAIVNPEKEKGPVEILLVDDKYVPEMEGYISDAANSRKKEDKIETNLKTAVDLKGALANLDAITGNKKAGVITDLYFPKETGSDDWSEGDKILDEICAHYKLDIDKAHEILKKYRTQREEAMFIKKEIFDKANCTKEHIAEKAKEKWPEISLDEIESDLIGIINDLGLIGENDIRNIIAKNTSNEEFKKNATENEINELGEKLNSYTRSYPSVNVRDIITNKSKLKDEQLGAVADLFACLVSGNEAGQPLGIRIVEEAYKRGIPTIICTSHHAVGQHFVPLLVDYLKDKNVIEKTNIFLDLDNNLEQRDKVKEMAKDSEVFLMFKGVTTDNRTKRVPELWGIIYNELMRRVIEK